MPIKNFKVTHLGDRRNRGSFMIQIILNSEQEKLLQKQLETLVFSLSFNIFANRESNIKSVGIGIIHLSPLPLLPLRPLRLNHSDTTGIDIIGV
ncbi:MAG: hypothetical protein U7126_14455 [Microcoleus sp.]